MELFGLGSEFQPPKSLAALAQLIGDLARFALTARIAGYWNRSDTEIDLVALNEDNSVIRFGSCKRSGSALLPDLTKLDGHIQRFLKAFPKHAAWKIEKVAIAPKITDAERRQIQSKGHIPQDLNDLTAEF